MCVFSLLFFFFFVPRGLSIDQRKSYYFIIKFLSNFCFSVGQMWLYNFFLCGNVCCLGERKQWNAANKPLTPEWEWAEKRETNLIIIYIVIKTERIGIINWTFFFGCAVYVTNFESTATTKYRRYIFFFFSISSTFLVCYWSRCWDSVIVPDERCNCVRARMKCLFILLH